jgi:PhzF family phenazine biosynthesis protein
MTHLPYYEIHAFADPDIPFSGNPAGVCLMDGFPEDSVLAGIANSNNLSETAFLVPKQTDVWDLRWFTPAVEVDLCGHATFAAGAVVLENGAVRGDTAHFETRSGRLSVGRGETGFTMDLPQIGFAAGEADSATAQALGLAGAPVEVFDVERIHGADYQMWVMGSEAEVRAARPDHGRLRDIGKNVILTAPGTRADFVSRFFAPASGVDEDPVTGSAHCTLAPYWADRLGKPRMTARQIGPRPGLLEVEPAAGRVTFTGHAPRYLDGSIAIGPA